MGNLINHDGTYLGYGGPNPGIQNGARPHLVTHFSGNPTPRYVYDANGNMTQRNDGTTTWTQAWTQENMLQQATAGTTSVTMIHDGDNQLMRRVENVNGVVTTIIYLGKLLENTVTPGNTYKKYYLFNGRMMAMREGLSSGDMSFFATDHLGSVNTTLWADGSVRSDLRYPAMVRCSMLWPVSDRAIRWQPACPLRRILVQFRMLSRMENCQEIWNSFAFKRIPPSTTSPFQSFIGYPSLSVKPVV